MAAMRCSFWGVLQVNFDAKMECDMIQNYRILLDVFNMLWIGKVRVVILLA